MLSLLSFFSQTDSLRQPLLDSREDDEDESALDNSRFVTIEGTQIPICDPKSAVRLLRDAKQTPSVQFDRLTLVYRPGLPPALRECSFRVNAGERFGICGRSGAVR